MQVWHLIFKKSCAILYGLLLGLEVFRTIYHSRSAKKRKENRTARELLAEALAKDNRKGKGMEKLAENYASGDINAIKLGQTILGEDLGPVNGTTINLIVSGEGETASLDRWAKPKE